MNLTEREKALALVKDGYHSVCELKLGQLSEGQEWDVRAGQNTHQYDKDPLILIPTHQPKKTDTSTPHERSIFVQVPLV